MTRTRRAVATGAAMLTLSVGAVAQTTHDRLVVGQQCYLRSRIILYGDYTEAAAIDAARTAGSIAWYSVATGDLHVRTVRLNRAARLLRPVESMSVSSAYLSVAFSDAADFVAWCDEQSGGAARLFPVNGAPSSTLLLTPPDTKNTGIATASNGARYAAAWDGGDDCLVCSIRLRVFLGDGTTAFDTVTLAQHDPPTTSDYSAAPRVSLRTGGTSVVSFSQGRILPDEFYLYVRSVGEDGVIGPKYQVDAGRLASRHSQNSRVIDDLYLRVVWQAYPSADNIYYSQTFDLVGQPVSPRTSVDPFVFCALAQDGTFVVAYEEFAGGGGSQPLRFRLKLRLYGADGSPRTAWFDPAPSLDPQPSSSFGFLTAPVALGPDGSIWLVYARRYGNVSQEWSVLILRPFTPGDMNGDGLFNNFDIEPFVLGLIDRPVFEAAYPDVVADVMGDMNGDGVLNNFDIDPFVEALVGAP